MFKRLLSLAAIMSVCACRAATDEAMVEDDPRFRGADAAARGLEPGAFPRMTELAPGVFSYEVLRPVETGGTTNSLIVVTSEGVLVADGQGSVDDTQRMVDAIGAMTDQPITHVVIGSDHGDHVSGNSAFPPTATFLAHPTSAAVLAEVEPPLPAVGQLVADRLDVTLGDKLIQVLHLGRAHTGGDLVVYLPAEKVLFLGEVFFNQLFPSMRSAFPSEWIEVIERAQSMDVDVFVPGHGFVDPAPVLRDELQAYKEAMAAVIQETTRLHAAGLSVEEALAQADFGPYESWMGRDRQVERGIPRIYAELNGELPPKPD